MKRQLIRCGIFLVAASDMVGATPEPQPQVSFTEGAGGTWNTDWSGVTLRTYFLKWSLDLVNWHYAPLMEFGTGMKSFGINTQGERKFFVRLFCVDAKGIANLAEAEAADYDGDGVSNRYEVEVEMSDPMDGASHGGDSDGDGLPDGWEREYFGNLTHNGAVDSDGDGLSDAQEWQLGSNPLLTDTDGNGTPDGTMRQELEYDRVGRLTSADAGAAGAQVLRERRRSSPMRWGMWNRETGWLREYPESMVTEIIQETAGLYEKRAFIDMAGRKKSNPVCSLEHGGGLPSAKSG